MRGKFILVLLLLVGIIQATNYSINWGVVVSSCNLYQYTITQSSCSMEVRYQNGTVATALYNTCSNLGYPIVGARIYNDGNIQGVLSNGGLAAMSVSPIPCTAGSCNYYFNFQVSSSSDNYILPITNIPIYSGCTTPTLNIVNSYPSTIMSDRYRLNFTITNLLGWSGISCFLTLNSTGIGGNTGNSYSTTFNSNGSVDILYSLYSKEFTIAHVVCTYLNENNNTAIFEDVEFLLDNSKTYNIYDANRIIGRASTYPNYLTIGSTLTSLNFYVLSNPDRSNYGKDLIGSLTLNVDPATLNCTGVGNYTVIYITHTINTPPYSITVPNGWACISPTTIPVTLTVKDLTSGTTVATANFNIVWASGTMIADNVNLIKNTNTSNLELWASVSNLFTHDPIQDASNLQCNYSMTGYSNSLSLSQSFTGPLGVYKTNVSGILVQTDAYNTSIDPNTTNFTYKDEFYIQINCVADNYTSASISTTRWVSAKRVKRFICSIGTSSTDTHIIYYADPYRTQASYITCTVILDTDVNNAIDTTITNWLQNSNSLYLTLYSNYLSNDVNSPCPENKILGTEPAYKNNQKIGVYNSQSVINSLYAELPSCALTPITPALIVNNLVQFNAGDSFNSTTWSYYPTTTVVLGFNLSYMQGAQINNPIFAIENTKTTNKSIITDSDTLSCSNLVVDPNVDISSIVYSIYDKNNSRSCTFAYPATFDEINATRTYSNILTVSSRTCPFFASANIKGFMQCSASVYYSGQPTPINFYSNIIPYLTPPSASLPKYPNQLACTDDFWDLFKINCPNFITRVNILTILGNQIRDDPEMFVLEFFILIMGLFVIAILIIPIAKLILSHRQQQG